MGWLFHNKKLRHQTPADYITGHFTYNQPTASATVLATATVRGTIYAAIQNTDKTTDKSHVFAAVILFRNNEKEGFGYKNMDEGMGPCEVDCPDRIMRLLSPIADLPNPSYAADWRARVVAARDARKALRINAKKLAPGDKVKLPYAVRVGPISCDHFALLRFNKRTPIFVPEGRTGPLCRLRRAALAQVTITRA